MPVTGQYIIRDPTGNLVPAEVYNQRCMTKTKMRVLFLSFLQYLPIPDTIKNVPGRMSSAQNQYLFQASLPPLSYNTYYFEAKGIFTVTLKLLRHLFFVRNS